jgi:hypothetical protein
MPLEELGLAIQLKMLSVQHTGLIQADSIPAHLFITQLLNQCFQMFCKTIHVTCGCDMYDKSYATAIQNRFKGEDIMGRTIFSITYVKMLAYQRIDSRPTPTIVLTSPQSEPVAAAY